MTRSMRGILVLATLLVSLVPSVSRAQRATPAKPRAAAAEPAKDSTGVVIMREVFSYAADGRRDPFVSLMSSGELRPLLADLALIGVIYDTESPRRSVAILTDGSNGQTYRVMIGAALGRMKVAKIGPQDITFAVDEFGMSRQQTLVMDKTPKKDAKSNTTRRPQ